MDNIAQLAAWIEWRERCALDLCEIETRGTLVAWARARAQYNWAGTLGDQLSQAWHIFETHSVIEGERGGKKPKIRMFDVAMALDDDTARLRMLQAYAGRVLHTALRNYALRETWSRRSNETGFQRLPMLRIDHPDAPPLEAMLPPGDFARSFESSADREEMAACAQTEAEAWFAAMPIREQAALGAYWTDRPLNAPEVIKMAKCRKSQVYAARLEAVRRLAEALGKKYGSDTEPAMARELAEMILGLVGMMCAKLYPPENAGPSDS